MSTWLACSQAFEDSAVNRQLEWGCELPPFDALPSEALEKECDEWASQLASNFDGELTPPAEVAPWLLARLYSASAAASLLDKEGRPSCPGMVPTVLRTLLIDLWHEDMRWRWNDLMPLDDD